MATLGGATFTWNAIEQDYCIIETLNCLYELCDEMSVCYGGNDGTDKLISYWISSHNKKPVRYRLINEKEWHRQEGREKLSFFSNIAIGLLQTEYTLYVQADEVVKESCAPFIRQAIETGEEAFMISRINCWQSAYSMLNVSQNRKPCSTEVIRLAKTKYRCVDDAESIGVPEVSLKFVPDIRIYHVGFVRDKHKHLTKIRHMQEKVFLWEVDKRIHDNTNGFDCWKWGFTPQDVVPIPEKLPKFIKQWADARIVDPFEPTEDGEVMAKEWMHHVQNTGGHYDPNKAWWEWAMVNQ